VVVWPTADAVMVVTAVPASGDWGLRRLADAVLGGMRTG
jgi:hypothetical protein